MTSSYFLNKSYNKQPERVKNHICFGNFCLHICNESYIIVENAKIDNEEKFLKYLAIIQPFAFIEKVIKVEEGFHIYLNTTYQWDATLSCILIRYAWEGRYTRINDKFYQIYDLFMSLVDHIPQDDYLPLLLFCNNYILCNLKTNFNGDHCIAKGGYTNSITEFPKSITTKELLDKKGKTSGVTTYGFFTFISVKYFEFTKCETIEEFKKLFEDYQKL